MNDTFEQSFANEVSNYFIQKPDGDIDLIKEVRNSLLSVGLHSKIEFYDNNRFILEANNKSSSIQRFLLNRYWNQQLLCSNTPSIEVRYCLIPNGDVVDWLRLFRTMVLPYILENNLPINV